MPPPSQRSKVIVSYRGIEEALRKPVAAPAGVGLEVAAPSSLQVAHEVAAQVEPDPARRAELLGVFAEALRQLELADQDTDPDILASPQDQTAALVQSFLASGAAPGAEAEPVEAGGEELKFATDDLAGWFLGLFSWIRGIRKHPPVRPASARPDGFPDTARIFLVGDWGTNLYGAPVIAQTVRNDPQPFTLLLHLGDVYYSGTPEEVQERFLGVWPFRPEAISRAVNSNHEMYSGGWAYFDRILSRFEQASSYFAFQNAHWVLIGLDTGYVDHDLDDEQVAWLNQVITEAGGRNAILFSHHQLYSTLEAQGKKLYPKLTNLLESRRITAWYWGHEHRCALYDPHDVYGLQGRCIGHGGMPQTRKDIRHAPVEQTVGDALWRRLEPRNLVPGCLILDGPNRDIPGKEEKYAPHGYAVLELQGKRLTEIVYSARGEELWRNTIQGR
jgi:Calcineurin-like phosphoesterase